MSSLKDICANFFKAQMRNVIVIAFHGNLNAYLFSCGLGLRQ